MDKLTTEELIAELEKRGFRWGYLTGHGTDEPCTATIDGEWMVIADIEKTRVLIKPEDLFKEPKKGEDYF